MTIVRGQVCLAPEKRPLQPTLSLAPSVMFKTSLAIFTLPFALATFAATFAQDAPLSVVASDDFETGAAQWEILDPDSWKVAAQDGRKVLSQHVKKPSYKPPHRSPFHVAILKGPIVEDFEWTVRVRSTHKDYGHRDVCLFFGYQDAEHFYYAHLGKVADPHCNQLFIVNGAPRTKISVTTTEGTPWDDEWHTVKVVRKANAGTIEVYFDDMQKPIMTAKDTTFAWGRVGVGTFDDTADFDEVELRGVVPSPPIDHVLPETANPRR